MATKIKYWRRDSARINNNLIDSLRKLGFFDGASPLHYYYQDTLTKHDVLLSFIELFSLTLKEICLFRYRYIKHWHDIEFRKDFKIEVDYIYYDGFNIGLHLGFIKIHWVY